MSEGQVKAVAEVTLEDVRYVAQLATLELTAEEESRMQRDLNAILGHIAQLAELDTTAWRRWRRWGMCWRATGRGRRRSCGGMLVRASIERRAVMAAAPETDGRFFKVPKVIER